MKKVKLNHSPFEEIPTALSWDILSRLPTKTCLNCKLVSKEWYSIIINPNFATLRSGLYRNLLIRVKFQNGRFGFLLLDIDKSSRVDEKNVLNVGVDAMIKFKPKLGTPLHKLLIVNICNGIVCLKSYDRWDPYIVCNLLTGEHLIVEQTYEQSICSVESFGIGYCQVSQKYKLLSMHTMKHDKNIAKIQTLGSNEWRVIDNAPPIDRFYGVANAVYLHGWLYWYSKRDNRIWSFCFEDEQFLEIPTPDDMKKEYYGCVGVFDSCVSYSMKNLKTKPLCEIWLLKEHGVKDSWVKQFVVNTSKNCSMSCIPLLQMDNGELLVYSDFWYNLGACDVESGKYRMVTIDGFSDAMPMVCDVKFSKINL